MNAHHLSPLTLQGYSQNLNDFNNFFRTPQQNSIQSSTSPAFPTSIFDLSQNGSHSQILFPCGTSSAQTQQMFQGMGIPNLNSSINMQLALQNIQSQHLQQQQQFNSGILAAAAANGIYFAQQQQQQKLNITVPLFPSNTFSSAHQSFPPQSKIDFNQPQHITATSELFQKINTHQSQQISQGVRRQHVFPPLKQEESLSKDIESRSLSEYEDQVTSQQQDNLENKNQSQTFFSKFAIPTSLVDLPKTSLSKICKIESLERSRAVTSPKLISLSHALSSQSESQNSKPTEGSSPILSYRERPSTNFGLLQEMSNISKLKSYSRILPYTASVINQEEQQFLEGMQRDKLRSQLTPVSEYKRLLGVNVADKSTMAPFLEKWNSQHESEQILSQSYSLLKNCASINTPAFERQFSIYYEGEQVQNCNYVNKFIHSKGLIVKDDKLGKIKIENKISRFHNLSRLLMYTILTAFHKNNLTLMNLDQLKQEAIMKMIQRLKQSARKKTPKGLIKTDFFNHTHYNVLFLTLNESNIESIRKNPKDVVTHRKVYHLELEKPYQEIAEDIRYSNIIKKLAYHVMLTSYRKSKDDKRKEEFETSLNDPNSNATFREQYIDRAMLGINKLNQGILIQRF